MQKTSRPATEDNITHALFGRNNGGAPKEIREHLGLAVPAHVLSVVQAQYPGRPGLQPSPRPRGRSRVLA